MDISGIWKDPKTTIAGVLIVGVTVALVAGKCSFDQWWMVVSIIAGAVGGGLMLIGSKKEPPANG